MPVTSVSYTAEGWGVGELWFDGARLVWHELPRISKVQSKGSRPRVRATPTQGGESHPPPSRSTIPARRGRIENGSTPKVHQLVHRLQAYFAGERITFEDVELELEGWTQFQLDIVNALRGVAFGEVVSYADLARLAGHPRAQRAAGTFCARNRFGIVVPCHRVVSAGGLGSYGSLGPEYKRRLLALEGVTL